jgi:hypothetical protein
VDGRLWFLLQRWKSSTYLKYYFCNLILKYQ